MVRIRTGFEAIDNALASVPRGSFGLLGARPGVGKTTLGMQIARNVVAYDSPALFYSLEMPLRELQETYLVQHKGAMDVTQVNNIQVNDNPHLSFQKLAAHLASLEETRQYMPGLIVIDYLQLMELDTVRRTRAAAVAALAQSLKGLAQKYRTNILLLAQLNRSDESRPGLKDFRESGALEQTADYVLLMNPPEIGTNLFDLWIAKNRYGADAAVQVERDVKPLRFIEPGAKSPSLLMSKDRDTQRVVYKVRNARGYTPLPKETLTKVWVLSNDDEVLATAETLPEILELVRDPQYDRIDYRLYIHAPVAE